MRGRNRRNENDVPAKEQTEEKGAWLQKAHEHVQRQKGTYAPPQKRPPGIERLRAVAQERDGGQIISHD